MKTVILAALALLASAPSYARTSPAERIYNEAGKRFSQLQKDGKIDGGYLNPIFCVSKDERLALVLTDDFRFNDVAYLVSDSGAQLVKPATLGIERSAYKSEGEYETFQTQLKGQALTCVTSKNVLE